jgi:CHAT domain-containing protein
LVAVDENIQTAFRRTEALRRAGRFGEALDGYQALISLRLAALESVSGSGADFKLTAADLVLLERAAELAVLFGYDEAADNLLASMTSALERARNWFGADYALLKRIHLALSFGRLAAARQLLRAMQPRIGRLEAINFSEAGLNNWEAKCVWADATPADHIVIFSRLYLIIGWLLMAVGRYRDALLALKRGLAYAGTKAPALARRGFVPLNLLLATALLEQGDLPAAQVKLDELKSQLKKGEQPGFYVRYLELCGKLNMLRGEFGGALAAYNNVLNICHAHGFQQAALAALLNLANALIFLNNTSGARRLLLLARSQAEASKDTAGLARATCLLALAQARAASLGGDRLIAPSVSAMRTRRQDTLRRNDALNEEPLLTIPPADSYLTLFEDRALEFQWQLSKQNIDAAAHMGAQLKEVFVQSDSSLIRARLQILEGMIAYYQGEVKKAEQLLRHSLSSLVEMGLLPEIWQVQRMLNWCWVRLGIPKNKRQGLVTENQQLLAQLTASLPTNYQSIFLLNKWTEDEEFIAGEINHLILLQERMTNCTWVKRPFRRLALMKRLYALLQYIEHYKATLAKKTNNAPDTRAEERPAPSLWQLLWQHPRDRATILFLVLPDRLFIAHLSGRTLDFKVSWVSRIQIRETIRRWHLLINRTTKLGHNQPAQFSAKHLLDESEHDATVAGTRNLSLEHVQTTPAALEAEARKVAEELTAYLQLPTLLEQLPSRVRGLTLIPHDSLLGFPFAAVTYQGSYLIERFNLNVAFHLVRDDVAAETPRQPQALFIGIAEGLAQFSPLPGVLPEIKELETWATKRNLAYNTLLGPAANKAAITKRLCEAAILHIACHGIFKADQPDGSGLVLMPTSNQVDILSLRDLSTLSLATLQHVSLSSCWSADNFILPGRWLIGLPETLCRAGARSVLASLWEVDDRVARSFMARFYDYLNEYPKDEALRRTHLDCLQKIYPGSKGRLLSDDEGIDTRAPFYWAGYTLYGDYKSLEL